MTEARGLSVDYSRVRDNESDPQWGWLVLACEITFCSKLWSGGNLNLKSGGRNITDKIISTYWIFVKKKRSSLMKDVVWIRAVGEHSCKISTVKELKHICDHDAYVRKVRLSIRYRHKDIGDGCCILFERPCCSTDECLLRLSPPTVIRKTSTTTKKQRWMVIS